MPSPYCARCDRDFVSEESLQQHLENSGFHNRCPVCPNDLECELDLINHIKGIHHGCDRCEEIYGTCDEIREHMHSVHLWCGPCQREFQSLSNLRAHLLSAHHIGRTVQCICTASFPTLSALALHIEENGCPDITEHLFYHIGWLMKKIYGWSLSAGEGPLFRDPAGTLDKWVLENGLTSKNRDGDKYRCYACAKDFERRTQFIRHLYGERPGRGDPSVRVRCAVCSDALFQRYSGLLQHRESGSCRGKK